MLHQMEKQDKAQREAEQTQRVPIALEDFMVAEFGPMRIEPAHQPFLRKLLDDLEITPERGGYHKWSDQVPFSPYLSEAASDPAFHLEGEEAEQTTVLDLMLLALRRIFESVEIVDDEGVTVTENPWRLGNPDDPDDARDKDTPYLELNHFWHEMRDDRFLRRRYWKRYMRDWINLLREEQYQVIRTRARFVGTPLGQMGFWNILASVLSHMATVKLRDWGSFYHLVGITRMRPNGSSSGGARCGAPTRSSAFAAAWTGLSTAPAHVSVSRARRIRCAATLRGEDSIAPLLQRHRSTQARTRSRCSSAWRWRCSRVKEVEGEAAITLTFESRGRTHLVKAKQVILALPQAPLQSVVFESSQRRRRTGGLERRVRHHARCRHAGPALEVLRRRGQPVLGRQPAGESVRVYRPDA